MIKVFNFAARKAAADTEGAFLKLVDKDIKERPESVAPLSKSLLDRVDAIEERAEKAEAANRDCVAHFEQMQAERDQALTELAALKRRIAEAPDATLTYRGKRCRLLLDNGKGELKKEEI